MSRSRFCKHQIIEIAKEWPQYVDVETNHSDEVQME